MSVEKKTTSIKIDPKLWREVKKYVIDKDISVTELVELVLKKELQKHSS